MSGCEIINDIRSEPIEIKLPKSISRSNFNSYSSQIELEINKMSESPTYSLSKNTPDDPIKSLLKKLNINNIKKLSNIYP
jgi:hypothetical protein